jgi:UDP-glucose 4-epimerase
VAEAVGRPCELVYVDRRDIDNVQRRVVNIEKARRILRWVPNIALDRGLSLTDAWLRRYQADGAKAESAA